MVPKKWQHIVWSLITTFWTNIRNPDWTKIRSTICPFKTVLTLMSPPCYPLFGQTQWKVNKVEYLNIKRQVCNICPWTTYMTLLSNWSTGNKTDYHAVAAHSSLSALTLKRIINTLILVKWQKTKTQFMSGRGRQLILQFSKIRIKCS